MTEGSWNPEINQSLEGKNTVDRDPEGLRMSTRKVKRNIVTGRYNGAILN